MSLSNWMTVHLCAVIGALAFAFWYYGQLLKDLPATLTVMEEINLSICMGCGVWTAMSDSPCFCAPRTLDHKATVRQSAIEDDDSLGMLAQAEA